MKLSPVTHLFLFLLGAVAGLLGDYCHVVTQTTAYLDAGPFYLGRSPLWFPLAIGVATVTLAEFRLRLGYGLQEFSFRECLGGVAATLALYALTALLQGQPSVPATVLVAGLAVLGWTAFGTAAGLVLGLIAAVGGAGVEAALAAQGVFTYADNSLFGVAPWLPALYFLYGVTVANLAEYARRPSPVFPSRP